MNLFSKRPLSLILCVILSGFSIFAILSPLGKAIAAVTAAFSAVLIFALPRLFGANVGKIAIIALICSFALSFLYFELLFYPNEFNGKECEIEADVLDSEDNDNMQELSLRVKSINGKFAFYKIKLYLYGDNKIVAPGSKVRFNAIMQGFPDKGTFDYKAYCTARGYSAAINTFNITVESVEEPPLEYRLRIMREGLCERARKLSDDDAGALLGALLLGERDMISGQLELDFRRIGITHVLSLGGMHLAILMGGFDRLLYVFRVGRKTRLVIGCIFCILFMALTGFPITVVRAGVMLIISSVLYLLSGCKDSITSLFLGSLIILIAEPYAAYDLGFWLSILATAGILLAGELLNRLYSTETGVKKALKSVGVSFLFSLFAIASTTALTALSFDSSSSIGIIATSIFAFPIDSYVYLGALMLIVGDFIPIGKILTLLCDLITYLSAFFSDMRFVFGSTSFLSVELLLIALSLLFAVFSIMNVKRRKLFISLLATVYFSSAVLSVGLTEQTKLDDRLTFYGSDNTDTFILCSEGERFMLDSSYHTQDGAYTKIKLLAEEKIVELDYYVLTTYSAYATEELEVLLSNISIEKIMLPFPQNEYDEKIVIEILSLENTYRTSFEFYEEGDSLYAGNIEIILSHKSYECNAFSVIFYDGDKIYSYLSSGVIEQCPESYELIYVSDTVIFGDYGTSYENPFVLDEFADRLNKVIINGDGVLFDKSESDTSPELYTDATNIRIFD